MSPSEDARALIAELDQLLGAVYDAEQRHGLSLDQVFQPNVRFFVAYMDGAPVGCGGVALFDGFAEVKRMFTRQTARGRGVAKALLARLEQEARAAGKSLLRLETGTFQSEAIGLYEGCGFSACGPFGHYAALEPHRIAASLFYEKTLQPKEVIPTKAGIPRFNRTSRGIVGPGLRRDDKL
ncbi:MAG TPA: GNAT family N-acetyltransferase [Stellaceae bacterium]